jgi:PPOX class probable FMN-dependent enzyme
MQFSDVIRSEAELRSVMGNPVNPAVVDKTLSRLDRHCIAFIERSPFVLVSSADAHGRMDISPKGDAPGFVKVLDETTLVIPDRPGNQRFDTHRNLIANPRVGLIFLIPGKRETLRVSGTAQVVRDASVLASLAAQGKNPALALGVTVEEAFMHCAKCMIRSNMWQPDAWPSLDGLASFAEAMKDAAAIPLPVAAIESLIQDDETGRLY